MTQLKDVIHYYLPHKLKIKHGDDLKVMNTGTGSSKHWIGIGAVIKWHGQIKADCKPVLMPLSYLSMPCLPEGKTPSDELRLTRMDEIKIMAWGESASGLSLDRAEFLFKHHFDLFGLIESGQAVDINTLK